MKETAMRTKILAILLTLGFALWGAAVWADEFTQTTEPFARSAEVYTEGYQAFAPATNLPTREDLVIVVRPSDCSNLVDCHVFGLKNPNSFQFELQTVDLLELGGASIGN